jgi:carboxyl-terminal processing protease
MIQRKLPRQFRYLRRAILMSSCFLAGFCCALIWVVGGSANATKVDNAYRNLRMFGQVLSYVQQNYVDDIDEKTLIQNAIIGLLSELDPYTTFLRPGEYKKLQEDTAGEFGGVGIHLTVDKEGVLIEGVVENGPAERAGLLAGDRMVAIEKEKLVDPILANVVDVLRGVPGTRVLMTIARDQWEEPREIALVRRHVRVPSISHEIMHSKGGDAIAYVRIKSFQERTAHDLSQVLSGYQQQTRVAGGITGIILDLRDNPGGLFDQGVMVADLFLSEGDIVRTMGRNPRNVERQKAHPSGAITKLPLVLLVNEGTASASEIVAGALQDQGRAVVLGQNSYGKGSVQTLFGLDGGAGLKLTVARYYTPNGRSIQEETIKPDIVLAKKILAPGAVVSAQEDPEIAKSLEVLDNILSGP